MSPGAADLLSHIDGRDSPIRRLQCGPLLHPTAARMRRCRPQIVAAPDEISVGAQPCHFLRAWKLRCIEPREAWHGRVLSENVLRCNHLIASHAAAASAKDS